MIYRCLKRIFTRRDLALLLCVSIAVCAAPLVFTAAKLKNNSALRSNSFVPQGPSEFIRQIPLTTNDIVYNPVTKQIHTSVPSSVGVGGNSIVSLDPLTGITEAPIFIGSEPGRLALADDGASLYVSLEGIAGVRRFDVPSKTPGMQFLLGKDSFSGVYALSDLAVAPGNPNLLAIARNYRGLSPPEAGVAVFDNGVQRTTVTPGHTAASDFLAFSASADKLYGCGFQSNINVMTISPSGVSVTNTLSSGAANGIRFDNGLVYASNGQVINPTSGVLLGTFSGVAGSPFTTDASVGRAYYLTGSQSSTNYSVALRAFDNTTFLPVGTLTIPGINGAVSRLVRWGSNGLAFRSSGGQLFLIQTTLVPSADPIPNPTATPLPSPTPAPSPPVTFVRQVPLTSNDITYSPATQMLYASIPSAAGSEGNSIRSITPETGALGAPAFIGSEPTKLSISDDGLSIYAALDGAAAVRRFDVPSQTAGLQFPIATGLPLFATGLSVAPGQPDTVAVARANRVSSPNSDGVAVYDNGVRRASVPNIAAFSVAFSNNPTRLFSSGSSGIDRLAADSGGVTLLGSLSILSGGEVRYVNGVLYTSLGSVVDPDLGMKGSFTGVGSDATMTTDSANGRAFFVSSSFGSSVATLRVYDLNTFVPLGSFTLNIPSSNSFNNTPNRLVRWGTNGLAFRTPSAVFIIQSSLVSSSGVVPSPTPNPSPTPSPTPTPYVPTFIRQLNLPANDLVINAADQKLYASVPSVAGPNGNSITAVNPQTGAVGPSTLVGSEPNRLALSDDGTTIHVSLDGAAAIRSFNIPGLTAGTQFSWGTASQRPLDMAVVPGSPLALATTDGTGVGAAIYDNGVRRANTGRGGAFPLNSLAFASPTILYGYESGSSSFQLVKLDVDANGVSGSPIASNLLTGFVGGIKYANGRLYSGAGRVVDPAAKTLLGTFSNFAQGSIFTVDPSIGRIFYLSTNGGNPILSAFDINTFLPLGSVTLTGITGNPVRLVRWGTNGLAFNTVSNSFPVDPLTGSKIYLLQSNLVSSASPIPTGIQLSASSYNTFEGTGLTITVTRTGDVSAQSTIDFATSDDTAVAGQDYTAASGTLIFAPGQLSKTFVVTTTSDNLYEGGVNEKFNVTLSNPTGGAVLNLPSSAQVTINDSNSKPTISIASTFRATEGNSGPKIFSVPVTLSNASVQTVSCTYTTTDGTARAGTDYDAVTGTVTFAPGSTSSTAMVSINGDTLIEPDETFLIILSSPVNANTFFSNSQATVTIANDENSFQLSAPNYSIGEFGPTANIQVLRTGDLAGPATIDYATSDTSGTNSCSTFNGAASARCDYIATFGTLRFATGENAKTVLIPIIDDTYQEGSETFTISLSNPTGGMATGFPASGVITLTDNDFPNTVNPLDTPSFFVREQYYDFLNRTPDSSGLNFWINEITSCGSNQTCIQAKRVNVSAAFFLSIEFQDTGYLIERIYKAAYGDASGNSTFGGAHPLPVPIIRLNEFLPDTQAIGLGIIVGQGNWQQQIENNKQAFTAEFVQRSRFTTAFPNTMTAAQFVDKLNTNAGNPLSSAEGDQLVSDLSTNAKTRAQVLRAVAEDSDLNSAEFNRAFVLMQFFGYLRRNPNDAPDSDYTGFDFWLTKLNQFNGNFQNADMVKAFISSGEYRQRFGP